jgi:hypothetical protein
MNSFGDFESAFQSPARTEVVRRSLALLQPLRLEYLLHPLLSRCTLSEDEKRRILTSHRRSWATHLRQNAIRDEVMTALGELPAVFSDAPRSLQAAEVVRPLPARERIEIVVANDKAFAVAIDRLRKRGFQHIFRKRQFGQLNGFVLSAVLRRNMFLVAIHIDGNGALDRAAKEPSTSEDPETKTLAPMDEIFLSLSHFFSAWLHGGKIAPHLITISQQLNCYSDTINWDDCFQIQRRAGTDRLCASIIKAVCTSCDITNLPLPLRQTLEECPRITFKESDNRITKMAKLFRVLGVRAVSFLPFADSYRCLR